MNTIEGRRSNGQGQGTPESVDDAKLRVLLERCYGYLRNQYGDSWVEDHRDLIDDQWRFIKAVYL